MDLPRSGLLRRFANHPLLARSFPEITDADQEALEGQIDQNEDVGPFKKQTNLFLGIWSQFCYVGAQVAVAGYFINFCEESGRDSAISCKWTNFSLPR
jgi:FHS family L-fucose permease-like MFS transporter